MQQDDLMNYCAFSVLRWPSLSLFALGASLSCKRQMCFYLLMAFHLMFVSFLTPICPEFEVLIGAYLPVSRGRDSPLCCFICCLYEAQAEPLTQMRLMNITTSVMMAENCSTLLYCL